MKKFIVSTTINPPTRAIQKYDYLYDWTLIVVGDQRTPLNYRLDNGIYITPKEQEKLAPELSELIGWNCIQRRNLGFVLALDLGADIVATIDDDNVPLENWGEELLVGKSVEVKEFECPNRCFDPIGATEHHHLWHRGYPLQLISSRNYLHSKKKMVKCDVQAGFWNGDPDVDAICRLEHRPDVTFKAQGFPFTGNAVGPFNSQNTFLTREALQHYFMVPGVGRADDIWASYHMQANGFRVVYSQATVKQERNEQDLTKNLIDEFLNYEKSESLVSSINDRTYNHFDYWPERACLAFDAYRRRIGS